MQTILVPVDGSPNSARAVKHVVKLASTQTPLAIHLLNVQPPIISGEVRRFISKETIESYQRDEGMKDLESAKALLESANVPYTAHIVIGQAAEVISQQAGNLSCDAIVMGSRGLGSIVGMVMGSVTTKVLHLVELPVTLIK